MAELIKAINIGGTQYDIDLSSCVKFGTVSKSTVDGTNSVSKIFNIEGEELISNYYKYWYVLNFGQYSGGNFATQIAMPYQDSLTDSELFIRSAKNGSWRTWRRVLHDGNYTTYCMPAGDTSHGTHVTNGAQTWSGKKTFSGGIAITAGDENTAMPYFLGIDAYADGGTVKYIPKSKICDCIGVANVKVNNAGYADSAGSANSVAWSNVSSRPGNFTGASSSAAGSAGFVPAPSKGQQSYLLQGNGSWVSPYWWNKDSTHISTGSSTVNLNDKSGGSTFVCTSWDYAGSSKVNSQPWGDGGSSAATVTAFPGSYPWQLCRFYSTNDLYIRGYYSGTGWTSWEKIALSGEAQPASDVYAWAKAASKPSYKTSEVTEETNLYFTNQRAINACSGTYLKLSGGTMTGAITLAEGQNKGINFSNGATLQDVSKTDINNIILFKSALRFQTNDAQWDYSQWAGLKYDHSNKSIYLGLPGDGTIFTKNTETTKDGTLKLPNISSIKLDGNKGETYTVLHSGNSVGIFSSTQHSDYNNNQGQLITRSFMSYWNGAYNSSGSSNLTYCVKGAFGSIVTKSTTDYATSGHTHTSFSNNIAVTGKVSATQGFYEESDERLKSFKDPIKVDLEKLYKLRKSYFTFNSDPDNLQIGVSAQEIQSLYPELVAENENGNLTVAYDKLSVIALAAVDQLSTELNTLKDELQQIKAHLNLI